MNETAIQANPPLPKPVVLDAIIEPKPAPNPLVEFLRQALKAAASLRVTVVLFALSLVLIYYGTWVQKELGVWTAVETYFRSAFVWIPIRVLSMYTIDSSISIIYPGGWLLGGLLLGNLLAAHAVRFKMTWKRSGIFLIHSGIVVMMLSELITGMFSIEGYIAMQNGEAINYVTSFRTTELAVVRPLDSKTEDTIVVPEGIVRGRGGRIQHADLPFDIVVDKYMVNSDLVKADGKTNPASAGIAHERKLLAIEKPEISGIDGDEGMDVAAAYVTLFQKGTGKKIDTYLITLLWRGQEVKVADNTYQISLRHKRSPRPYTLHLINMRHDTYLGSSINKNFSSLVRLVDPERKEDREVLISMNDPLRHRGETFYQQRMGKEGTQLAVVRNPGWLMPYISCAMVALGMLIHFGLHLVRFLEARP